MTKNKFAKKWRARCTISWRSTPRRLDRAGRDEEGELRAKGYGFYASGALESLTKLTYDEIVDQEIGFMGFPRK